MVVHRQRIVTLEDRIERQPWPAWGGEGWLCFSGRLDDRAHLAQALGIDSLAGLADGQLACRAVERWQEDAPSRLLGDFSLAAWHEGERKLILAADPSGLQTVYFWQRNDLILFSNSLRGLLAAPQIPRVIDETYLADFMALNFADDHATFYRGVRKVVPGTCIVVSLGGLRSVQSHCFDPERRLRLRNDDAYLEAARTLLDQAVADRMRSVAPVPISASGGLDSACLAIAARAGGRKVTLLTAVPEPEIDVFAPDHSYVEERPLVEALIAVFPDLQAEFHAPPPGTDWSPDTLKPFTAGGVPYRNPSHMAWFDGVYRRAGALGARAILNGGVGNHTLTWDGLQALPSALRRGRLLFFARELVMGSGGSPRRLGSLLRHVVIPPLVGHRSKLEDVASLSGLTTQAAEDLGLLDRMRQRRHNTGFVLPADSREARIHSLIRGRNLRLDVMSALRSIHGLEIGMPLVDSRLVAFCLAIPEDQFLRHGTTRFLARRLLRAAGVPRIISENPRRGLQHPEWFAHMTQIRPTLPDQIDRLRRSATARRLIDIDRLAHMVDHWPADAAEADRQRVMLSAVFNKALSAGAFIAWVEGTN